MRALSLLFLIGLTLSINAAGIRNNPSNNRALKPDIQTLVEKINPPLPTESILAQTSSSSAGGLTSSTIDIVATAGNQATLNFGSGDNAISLALDAQGDFHIATGSGSDIVTIDSDTGVSISATTLTTQSLSYTGSLTFGGITQWKLVVNENFWSPPTGWTNNEITVCGGAYLLGGYCVLSRGEEAKIFSGLPTHTTVRVMATFHYIDAWNGETAFLQLNSGANGANEYVWTDRYDSTMAVNSINICGATYGEGRFAVPIDVYIPHTADSIKVTFGTTVDQDPCDQSWGISNLQVYVM